MSEARLAVQRALDKLINRFGNTGEVIGELRNALRAMDKTGSGDAGDSACLTAESSATPVQRDEPETQTETPKAEPPPKKRASARRKAK